LWFSQFSLSFIAIVRRHRSSPSLNTIVHHRAAPAQFRGGSSNRRRRLRLSGSRDFARTVLDVGALHAAAPLIHVPTWATRRIVSRKKNDFQPRAGSRPRAVVAEDAIWYNDAAVDAVMLIIAVPLKLPNE